MAHPKLLGFQFADASGKNIHGDENDPSQMASFEVMSPGMATAMLRSAHLNGFLLMPIYEGMIEKPRICAMHGENWNP